MHPPTLVFALGLCALGAQAQTVTRPDPVRAPASEREPAGEPPARPAPEFFGQPVTSARVAFVIDVSGSMQQALEGPPVPLRSLRGRARPGVETRLQRVQRELLSVLSALPDETAVNLHWFESRVGAWSRQLRPLAPKARASLERTVQRLQPGGATNLYDALAQALRDPAIEVVYLLSDGSPTTGRYKAPAQILRAVDAQLRGRRVTLHTVSVGGTQDLLRQLAERHGGTHRAL